MCACIYMFRGPTTYICTHTQMHSQTENINCKLSLTPCTHTHLHTHHTHTDRGHRLQAFINTLHTHTHTRTHSPTHAFYTHRPRPPTASSHQRHLSSQATRFCVTWQRVRRLSESTIFTTRALQRSLRAKKAWSGTSCRSL